MILPMNTLCGLLARHVQPALIAPAAWRRIVALSAQLPPLFSWILFECRLQKRCERVDVLVCISKWEGGAVAAAAALASRQGLPSSDIVAAWLAAWLRPGTPVSDEIPLLWLEYDFLPESVRAPFVQFCVERSYPRSAAGPRLSPEALRRLAADALGPLLGGPADEAHLAALQRCAERLPTTGHLLHLGVMPQRGSRDLRVLASLPKARVADWLHAIDWPGSPQRLGQLLALLGPEVAHASVQLDVGERVRPTLAIEYPLPADTQSAPAWRRFVASLVDLGVCDPDKGAAALAWQGRETHRVAADSWPVHVQRGLDIKLVLGPDGSLEAKAYLAAHPAYGLH